MAGWNVDSRDWENPNITTPASVLEMLGQVEPPLREKSESAIIVMHDWVESTPEILLPAVLEYFFERNYEFVSVAECFDRNRGNWYKPIPGFLG